MSAIYEIQIYNSSLEKLGELQGWEYLEFTQRVNSPWNHAITIKTSPNSSYAAFIRDSDGMQDWIFLVYRTDPILGIRHLAYEGFNRTIVDQLDNHGDVIFNFYGVYYFKIFF